MASIPSLLNPLPEVAMYSPRHSGHPTLSRIETATSSQPGRQRVPARHRIPKDAPVFKEDDTKGEIRYPPCEERPGNIAKEHQKLRLFPMGGVEGEIMRYPRTIPYKSDKKSFEEKTGRSKFEVFQYTFRYGTLGEEWFVMWDYNIGLVRITHLFKALGYSKTTPAKVLAQNPGLRDICHSITGGAIAAQGYWMPFEAAKALAIRFCYPIRYALTPMFGTDFPDMCLEPGHERFGNFILDPSIIESATRTAHYYRSIDPPGDTITGIESSSSTVSSNSPVWRAEMPLCPPVMLDEDRSRSFKWPRRNYADSIASTRGSSSEPYCLSPSSPVPNSFTPVNAPRSHVNVSPTEAFLTRATDTGADSMRRPGLDKREHEMMHLSGSQLDSLRLPGFASSGRVSDRMVQKPCVAMQYEDSDAGDTNDSAENDSVDDEHDEDWHEHASRCSTESSTILEVNRSRRKRPLCSVQASSHHSSSISGGFAQEVKAAHALIHLHMQEAMANDEDDVSMGDRSPNPCRLPLMVGLGHGCRKRRRASV